MTMPIVGKKIETTVDNFGDQVAQNCLLVDKTLMIREFWEGSNVSLVTRPRRSGKTLNMSMLRHFFAPKTRGVSTAGLFEKFQIAQIDGGSFLREHQGKYPVIFITLKGMDAQNYEGLVSELRVLIKSLYQEHEEILSSERLSANDKKEFNRYLTGDVNSAELEYALKFLSQFLYKAHGQQVIILIDEYDSPLSMAYHKGFLEEASNFFRSFLGHAFKSNEFLRKGLLTGILRVSKNNMLSGLNNLEVYTVLDSKYNSYFGFTESEVQELLARPDSPAHALEGIRAYYNGYKIGSCVIYNPWSVMKFLDNKKLMPYWVLTSNDKLLKQVLINSPKEFKGLVTSLIQGGSISAEVSFNLRYEDLMTDPTALWTLLISCGYLTAEKSEPRGSRHQCELRIPNAEVRVQYTEIFGDWLKGKIGFSYNSFLTSLVEGRVEEFVQKLTAYLFSCTSSHDFQAEADYHAFVLGLLCSAMETHFVFSNKEYAAGRPDCLLIPKNKDQKLGVVLEFKHFHFKKGDDRRNVELLQVAAQQSAEEGLSQIDFRGYAYAFSQHQHLEQILKVGLAFSNRIVCSAHLFSKIENGVEASLSESPVIVVAHEENTEKNELREKRKRESDSYSSGEKDKKNNKKKRIIAPDSEESSSGAYNAHGLLGGQRKKEDFGFGEASFKNKK